MAFQDRRCQPATTVGKPVPVLLSSPIDIPAGELAEAIAADESRCCLREWLARVPGPRSRLGRWHPLEFVLGLAVCAFTAAGHDSPAAVAEWAVGCSQDTLAALGGRRGPWAWRMRPPSARTFSRIFGAVDAGAFNAALYVYLAVLPTSPPDALPPAPAGTRASSAAPPQPSRLHREPAERLRRHPQPGHRCLLPRRVRQHRPRPPLLRPQRPPQPHPLRIHLKPGIENTWSHNTNTPGAVHL